MHWIFRGRDAGAGRLVGSQWLGFFAGRLAGNRAGIGAYGFLCGHVPAGCIDGDDGPAADTANMEALAGRGAVVGGNGTDLLCFPDFR